MPRELQMLSEKQFADVMRDFWNQHHGDKTYAMVADGIDTSTSTVKGFAAGRVEIGLYNLYQILFSMGVPMTAMGEAFDARELQESGRTKDDGMTEPGGVVRDVSGYESYGSVSDRRGTAAGTRNAVGVMSPEKEALQIIQRAGDNDKVAAVLREREFQVSWDARVNQSLQQYLIRRKKT